MYVSRIGDNYTICQYHIDNCDISMVALSSNVTPIISDT